MCRRNAYKWLATKMQIKVSHCHFGWFDLVQLKKAYEILKENESEELSRKIK